MSWKKVKDVLLVGGRVAAPAILNAVVPGAGKLLSIIIQGAEDTLGSGTGPEKKQLVVSVLALLLEIMAKSGRLDSAAPTVAELEKEVEAEVKAMKAAGTLEESGVAIVGKKRYAITVTGLLPE